MITYGMGNFTTLFLMREKGMTLTPPTSSLCCAAAPFVLQFDADGKLFTGARDVSPRRCR